MRFQNSAQISIIMNHYNTSIQTHPKLHLHALSLTDRDWITRLVRIENSKSADFNFGNLFLWDQTYCPKVAQFDDRLIIEYRKDDTLYFSCPIGEGPLDSAVIALQTYADSHGFPLLLRGITTDYKEELEQLFPDCFTFTPDTDFFDYVYEAEKLATLQGKKLHGKRNHVNRFEAEHDWRFVPLTQAYLPVCRAFLQQWIAHHDIDAKEERMALERAFLHFNDLGLEGGALLIGEELVGFTIGEPIADDTFDVHFEKARSDINGAYSMVNREFVRQILDRHPEIVYINREEDMGLENLRLAKQSYHPAFLVEKYTARLNDGSSLL